MLADANARIRTGTRVCANALTLQSDATAYGSYCEPSHSAATPSLTDGVEIAPLW